MKVFIVEDNESNVALFLAMLRNEKYIKTVFNSAEDLLDHLERERPDVILMDWGLPNMSGVEATKVIRQNKAWKDLPIVIISAHAFREERDLALEAGASGYITKPIDMKKLIQTVDALPVMMG